MKSEDIPIAVIDPAATDALLKSVIEQIDLDTFDADDAVQLQQLVECLGDPRGLIRLRVAQTLGDLGGAATPLLVAALLNHVNPVVRRAAGKTLALIMEPSTVPDLLHALLNDEDTVVRGSAVGALAKMGEASVPALLSILADPIRPESTKGHAAWALGFIGAEAAPFLESAIRSDSIDVRCAAVGAIANLAQQGDERAVQLLIATLSDVDPNVRSEAASAIGKMAYLPALPNLITALGDPDGEVRRTAAVSLGKLGDRSAIPALEVLLTDDLEPVRVLAKLAITKIENL
jgi:bilin biosynthesis protein